MSQGGYNITVGEVPVRYIWFRVAKNGTRSALFVLRQHTQAFGTEYGFDIPVAAPDYSGYFSFAFVRNPYARVISGWMDKVHNGNNGFRLPDQIKGRRENFPLFLDWLVDQDPASLNIHFRPQSLLVPEWVGFVGRVERFEEDFSHVVHALFGIASVDIPQKNRSGAPSFPFEDKRLARLVEEYYRLDFERFGYEMVADCGV